jgi:hypothetical protein
LIRLSTGQHSLEPMVQIKNVCHCDAVNCRQATRQSPGNRSFHHRPKPLTSFPSPALPNSHTQSVKRAVGQPRSITRAPSRVDKRIHASSHTCQLVVCCSDSCCVCAVNRTSSALNFSPKVVMKRISCSCSRYPLPSSSRTCNSQVSTQVRHATRMHSDFQRCGHAKNHLNACRVRPPVM